VGLLGRPIFLVFVVMASDHSVESRKRAVLFGSSWIFWWSGVKLRLWQPELNF
jgi:hypothetical protein